MEVIAAYFQRKKYRRLKRGGYCGFVASWEHWRTIQQAITDLDRLVIGEIQKAITRLEEQLAELKPFVSEPRSSAIQAGMQRAAAQKASTLVDPQERSPNRRF